MLLTGGYFKTPRNEKQRLNVSARFISGTNRWGGRTTELSYYFSRVFIMAFLGEVGRVKTVFVHRKKTLLKSGLDVECA